MLSSHGPFQCSLLFICLVNMIYPSYSNQKRKTPNMSSLVLFFSLSEMKSSFRLTPVTYVDLCLFRLPSLQCNTLMKIKFVNCCNHTQKFSLNCVLITSHLVHIFLSLVPNTIALYYVTICQLSRSANQR